MKKSVALIGVGEMGSVFARGILKAGFPIHPLTRKDDIQAVSKQFSDLEAVVVAVGEKDLSDVLGRIPISWKDKLILLQNELLPRDWIAAGIKNPTVISVWFEKKPGQDYKVLIPSPVLGPKANLIETALTSIKIPVKVIDVTSPIGNKKMKTDSKTSSILIKINGENKSIPLNISILELLESLKINKDRVVIEMNKKILKKESFNSILLSENDELEIVTFVGGG